MLSESKYLAVFLMEFLAALLIPISLTGSVITEHNSAIQIFQYKVLKQGRSQQLKPGYHRIYPSKRSLKIFVWLQSTQGIVSYGR